MKSAAAALSADRRARPRQRVGVMCCHNLEPSELFLMEKANGVRDGLGRIQALRAAGDTEGLARFVLNGGMSRKRRRTFVFTPAETAAIERLTEERDADRLRRWKRGQQQDAYDRLCKLRKEGDGRMAWRFVRYEQLYYQPPPPEWALMESCLGDFGVAVGVPYREIDLVEVPAEQSAGVAEGLAAVGRFPIRQVASGLRVVGYGWDRPDAERYSVRSRGR
jgi:hypothetical protein